MEESSALLTSKEASNYLRIRLKTFYGMCQDGRMPAARVGKSWRVSFSELDEAVRSGRLCHAKETGEKG